MKEISGETSYQRSYRRNLCTLIKHDMNQLYHRLRDRYDDYMSIFSKRRTREHFKDIFISRYLTIPLNDMAMLDQDMIVSIDAFYFQVGELHWYLLSTEDMPATVMENVLTKLRTLKKVHETADAMLEASLQLVNEELQPTQDFVTAAENKESLPDFQSQPFSDNLGIDLASIPDQDPWLKKD